NAMPILTSYLIEADKDTNKLRFTASDLELTVIVEFEASVIESGKVTINAKLFNDVIANLPNTVLSFARDDEQLHVDYSKSDYHFLIANANRYPLIPPNDLENAVEIEAPLYKRMINNTSFAVLKEGNKTVYNGIYWKIDKENQIMASTDGTKIAEFIINKSSNIENESKAIIPLKGLSFLEKIIDNNSEELLYAKIQPNRIIYTYKNYIIYVNLLEGTYPDYTKAFPKEVQENKFLIDKEVLKSNVKRVSLLASEEFLKIRLDFSSNQELMISAINRELGDAKEILNNIDYDGNDLSLSLNYRHMLSIIEIIESDKLLIRMGNEKSPIMFYNEKKNDDFQVKFLLMPLRRRK
ncbi:MAG: DNA polymerase III subunit beta, partial [Candidatus Cloacimonadota bacterium]|nr:DNA polymerase III subunit beta [Candidatus Cloacimonadota bacterium]